MYGNTSTGTCLINNKPSDTFSHLVKVLSLYSTRPFSVLRWQLNPTQMKYTCDANDSTYTLYVFKTKWCTIWVIFDDYTNTL